MNKINEIFKTHKEFILYAIIGVTGVSIDFALFYVLHNYFSVPALLANIISVSGGIVNNFILNTVFNFKKKDKIAVRFASFFTIGIIGMLLSNFILIFFNYLMRFDATLVKIFSIPVVVVIQFILNKKISFRDFK